MLECISAAQLSKLNIDAMNDKSPNVPYVDGFVQVWSNTIANALG